MSHRCIFAVLGIGIGIVQLPSPAAGEERYSIADVEQTASELTDALLRRFKNGTRERKARIAVSEFQDVSGGTPEFGRRVADEIITHLFRSGRCDLIERALLKKVLEEQKLAADGLIDPPSAKAVGRILGADAILSASLCRLGASCIVNARFISTETGVILAAASSILGKENALACKELTSMANSVSDQITNGMADKKDRRRIAVVEFTDSTGEASALGRILSEQLLGALFGKTNVDVVERFLLARVLAEQKIGSEGLLDAGSVKSIGKLLGADFVVTARLFRESNVLKINATMIDVETGAIRGVGSATALIPNDGDLTSTVAGEATPNVIHRPEPFLEEFKQVMLGGLPKGWEGDPCISVQRDRIKSWLQASERGAHEIYTPPLKLAGNFRVDVPVYLAHSDARLSMKFIGNDNGANVLVAFDRKWTRVVFVRMAEETPKQFTSPDSNRFVISFEREGEIFRLLVNSDPLFARRLPECKDFNKILFSITGPTDSEGQDVAAIYGVRVGDLRQPEPDQVKTNVTKKKTPIVRKP